MKNVKKIVSLAAALMLFPLPVACGEKTLAAPENLTYADGILSFDEVEGATAYDLVFERKGEVVYQDTFTETAIDVESLGLEGNIKVSVAATAPKAVGTIADCTFTVLSTFDDVIIEAEDNLYNFGTGKSQSNFRNNPLARGGAYVGGLDDAGHGVYINYLCPFAGTYAFNAYYLTASSEEAALQSEEVVTSQEVGVEGEVVASHDVVVNGAYQTEFLYKEYTGYGGTSFNPAKATVQITLKKGWNTISIMKNGTSADNWGGFAELDYFVLEGNGEKYNIDDEAIAALGERPAFYRLEAEMGSPRKKNPSSNLMECKNPCIAGTMEEYSNGFLMGAIENTYDGVEWHFNSPVKAKYRLKLAYASGEFAAEGGNPASKKAKPSIIVTQEEVTPAKSVDLLDCDRVSFNELDYTGWNNVTVADGYVEIILEKGKNFIYCVKLGDSGFFQLDYADLIFVEEVE